MTVPHPGNYYAVPELAAAYDADTVARKDLEFYLSLAGRMEARRVADVGAGTGLLCSLLAGQGHDVVGVEPEETMLSLAAAQPHAGGVLWIHGTAEHLPDAWADLVLMTGHVAQYFLDDSSWAGVLTEVRRALRPGGRLAFEVRNPAVAAWRQWNGTRSTSSGTVTQTTRQQGDLVTHTDVWTHTDTGTAGPGARTATDTRTSGSVIRTTIETLRFPSWDAVVTGLHAAGLVVDQSWGNWDRTPVHPDSPEWIILTGPV